jgi:hypothetical protein
VDASGRGPMDLLAVEADIAAGVRVEWLERHHFAGAAGRVPAPARATPRFPGASIAAWRGGRKAVRTALPPIATAPRRRRR